jgi:hypothetical protein
VHGERVERDQRDRDEERRPVDAEHRQRDVEDERVHIREPRVPDREAEVELLALMVHAVDREEERDPVPRAVVQVVAEVAGEERDRPRDGRARRPVDEREVPVAEVVEPEQERPEEEADHDLAEARGEVRERVAEAVDAPPRAPRERHLDEREADVERHAERVVAARIEVAEVADHREPW